jgi:hypothetical protein
MKRISFIMLLTVIISLCMPGLAVNAAQTGPSAKLTSDSRVLKDADFILDIRLDGSIKNVYAEDITLLYDSDIFTINSVDPADDNTFVAGTKSDIPGKIRILAVNFKGLNNSTHILKLSFKIKDIKPETKSVFTLSDVKLGIAPDGSVVSIDGSSLTVKVADDKTDIPANKK